MTTLAVSVPVALAATACFGAASAVQHSVAHDQTVGGTVDVRKLKALLRSLPWMLAVAGDGVGGLLLVVALATGPVSLVQPLQVLGLLVALPVSRRLGGPRMTRRDLAMAVLLVLGLGTFLSLVGDPGQGRTPEGYAPVVVAAALLAAGGLVCLLTRAATPATRAVAYGAVSGAWFGLSAVLLRVVDLQWTRWGLGLLSRPAGVASLLALVAVGALGLTLTQVAFQVGPLASSLPAQIMADPVVAVLLGSGLLGEHVHVSPLRGVVYAVCLVAVAVSVIDLAGLQASAADGAGARDGTPAGVEP